MTKRVIINLEFQNGEDKYYAMPLDGTFVFNAFATLLEKNPITNVQVFLKDEDKIERIADSNLQSPNTDAFGGPFPEEEESETGLDETFDKKGAPF